MQKGDMEGRAGQKNMTATVLLTSSSWTSSTSTLLLSSVLLILMALLLYQKMKEWKIRRNKKYPPSPSALPLIGHMHHMRNYEKNPWDGFCALREKLGDIYSLKMGCRKIIVVSSVELMREVLVEKGPFFSDRPDFQRYHTIFDGDRENALALCDWSRTQRMRRVVATLVVLPRFSTHLYQQLNYCIKTDVQAFLDVKTRAPHFVTKSDVLFFCGNIFSHYLCSKRFEYGHEEFSRTVFAYDYIFWDINQSYIWDFMPWITKLGFASSYFKELSDVCLTVRHHMEDCVITPRLKRHMAEKGLDKAAKDAERDSFRPSREKGEEDADYSSIRAEMRDMRGKDFLDVSLEHHFKEPALYPWHVAVFEVLDLIGGSSAVGNLLMRLLGFLSLHPECQDMMLKEARRALEREDRRKADGGVCEEKCPDDVDTDEDENGVRIINLTHRKDMPFSEAAIQETLRLASSPIIPHVANRDTTLSDFDVDKDTMVLFNTYFLNFSEKHWPNARAFDPKRFLIREDEESSGTKCNSTEYLSPQDDGSIKWRVMKPKYFLPFSVGRRACLGYKLVKACTFSAVTNLVFRFRLSPESDEAADMIRQQLAPKGGLGLPLDVNGQCFRIKITPRTGI